ncbi:amino acid adenylation domain-containing protein [Nocardiopsis exhalans]|uniref:Phenyloxazoline synthase MbtB n=1 Tax=Nocardiopsis exhalans TaxID=163604 RepID=A0ABY5DG07_9ACTN|nr:non-ribosomal peptide synthetase [Nocardiopsis exhalans]USY22314.1 amino acid adenylation domain-containing protein [Nocardiopsis exhalans]
MPDQLAFPRSDSLNGPGGTPPATVADMRAQICELTGLPSEEVGDDTDLLTLGMDSIFVIRMAALMRRYGVRVGYRDLAEAPTPAAWWALARQGSEQPGPTGPRPSADVDPDAPFPLAVMQHAFWVGRDPAQDLGGVAAHLYTELDAPGPDGVDPRRLEGAVRHLVRRHGMLRVVIGADGTQRITEEGHWPGLTVHDLRGLSDDETDARLAEIRSGLSHRIMDIGAGEVFDVQLTLLGSGATRLHVNLDMVAADAFSLRTLLADLLHHYELSEQPLPEISYGYPHYLADRAQVRHERREEARQWWLDRLDDLPGAPELPVRSDRGSTPTVTRRHRLLTTEEKQTLRERARARGLTPSIALATAFAEVVGAWSATDRFILNLPVFDREPLHEDVDRLIGDFSSSVMLDVDLSAPASFAERAHGLQDRLREASSHAEYTGVEVLRDMSRAAGGERVLAPVVYTSALDLGDLFSPQVRRVFGEPSWIISQGPQVWLDAQVTEFNGGVLVNWDARDSVFPPGLLDAMFDAFTALMDRLLTTDDAWSEQVPVELTADQSRARALVGAAGPGATAEPAPVTEPAPAPAADAQAVPLHERFFALARAEPGRTALMWGFDGSMTYGELSLRARRLACLLRERGVGPGDSVGVTLPKGPDQAVAVLGILATGAAYVPSGVEVPPARRAQVHRAAGAALVVTDEATAAGEGPEGLSAVTVADSADHEPLPDPLPADPESVMYVIFTSGSTGVPKGVAVPHRAVANTVDGVQALFDVGPDDRTIALSALDFDLSAYDLFAFLACGGGVVVPDQAQRRDAAAWAGLVRHWDVTVLSCVPALLDMLIVAGAEDGLGDTLRLVMLGGDWVTVDLPSRLRALAPGCRFAGLGGMTEAAIHATVCEVGEVDPDWRAVPYGRPLPGVTCRVADSTGRHRPDWVPGELWVGGRGLAHGYRGDPERTAEKFVEYDGQRWYRTGDMARYLPDGTIEFLGRADHQVKIRGHRIELGEIESLLAQHPRVDRAIATVVEHASRQLAAAVVADEATEPAELRAWLAERVPGYMVPEHLVVLDAFPITSNGKTDRKALSRVLQERGGGGDAFEEPVGAVEHALARLWRDLLDAPRVGRDDGFFVLGGDSLLATRLMRRLGEAGLTGAELVDLFRRPVLKDFAALLAPGTAETRPELHADTERRHEPFPLTDVQRAFWIGRDERLPLGGVGSHFYLEFDGEDVDTDRLERAWNRLVNRHEMLRAVIGPDGTQRILPEVPEYRIAVTEAGDRPETALHRARQSRSHHVADTSAWPLFDIRAVRYKLGRQHRTRLLVGLDSIVMDGRSIMVLYSEWDRLHRDPDAELPPIGLSFRDYVLQAEPDPARRERAEAYWRERVGELPPAPGLPLAKDPASVHAPVFTRLPHRVDTDRWEALRNRAREHGLTPSVVLLACYTEVLARWSAERDLTVNLTLFDRRDVHPDIDRVVGDFASLLLVGHGSEPGEGFADTARRLQERQAQDLSHREASGVWILRELARRSGAASAAMPVVFTSVLGVGDDEVSLDLSEDFPDQIYGLTQTPQVWLDNKVASAGGGATVDWDAVDQLFPEGVLDAMFDDYVALVERLADADTDWSAPVPPLPPSWRELRDEAHEAARTVPASRPAAPAERTGDPDALTPVEHAVARIWADLLGVEGVGRDDGFFALGGDSILATRLMSRMRAEGLEGAELARLFTDPTLGGFAATVTRGEADHGPVLRADPERRHEPFPLTDVQAAYWLGRSEDFALGGIGAQLYNEYEWDSLDTDRLERAWNQLIARHEMLRAVVSPDGTQRILPEVPEYRISVTDAGDDLDAALEDVRERMCGHAIDAAAWPLFDIRVVRASDGRARVAVAFDNLVTDGLSILVLFSEWHRLYDDPDAALPPIGVSFRDYVLSAAPTPEALEGALAYWRGRMAQLPPGPRLPLRTTPESVGRPRFTRREARLDSLTWKAVREKAREHGLTPSVVLLACYTEVLGRWSAERDLTVNLTLFDRRDVHPDIDRVVGDFTSLLLVADRPEQGESRLGRARRLQEQVWRDLDHQDVSAVRVLRELAKEKAGPAEPVPVVFTSMLGVDDDLARSVRWPDLTRSQTPQVWLDHQVIELPDGLLLSWDSVDELFPEGTVEAMLEAYHRLLTELADADWDAPAPEGLPEPQRAVRARVNDTAGPDPRTVHSGLLHGGFFDQAERDPDRPALLWGEDGAMSYGELARWTLRIAALLADHGVRPGDPVAVSLPKGPSQVAALLGVLAAGGAYVPVAVDQPPVRRKRILATAGAAVLLHDGTAGPGGGDGDGLTRVDVAAADQYRCLDAPVPTLPDALAYVIFTSGSTGEPKGVEITHESAVNTLDDVLSRYGVTGRDRVLAVSAADFDLSVFDVFGLLAAGGGVALIEEEDRRDPQRWLELAHRHGVTVWNSVPAVLDMLLTAAESDPGLPKALRLALVSGDWVGVDLPGRLAEASSGHCRLIALGGATEASIWSNAFDTADLAPEWTSVPYGHPLRNQRFRVTDGQGRDRPDWVAGELWIGGTGVARGYRGDPELTAARFVERDGLRWYRTGDLGRYWPDGTLEFLGRQDGQVKIRGHRVELGEIEAAAAAHPAVARAVCVAVGDRDSKRLVAFVQPDGPAGATVLAELPGFLADRLPAHAVPDIVPVADLPLTDNGKVDRAQLVERAGPGRPPRAAEPPRTETEHALADVWGLVLGRAPAGRTDNFFTLGGDSLAATRLIQQADRAFGTTLRLRAFFADPTVAAMAEEIDHQRNSADDAEEGAL